MNIQQIERNGTNAIRRLRRDKHRMGIPFMINTKDLPSTHCYLEYPDGIINLVTIREDKMGFKVVSECTLEESNIIRKKYKIA